MMLRAASPGLQAVVDVITPQGSAMGPERDALWDRFIAAAPHGHLMQASSWGAVKARFGWEAERLMLMDGNTVVAGAVILYRSFPLNLTRLAYVPMGPIVDWENEVQVDALLLALRRTVRPRRAFTLKLEPPVLSHALGVKAKLAAHGFRPSPQSVQWKSTIVIDLDCTEDEILARFHQSHRYKVRKAARAGIIVRSGTAAELPAFSALLGETASRKDFAVYPPEYYAVSYELFAAQRAGQLLLATYNDEVVAGIMLFVVGETAYAIYIASGNAHRELMPAYLLHWEAIRWARAQGCTAFDYCGIPDEVGEDPERYVHEERHDGMWGVYRFKRGFGGQVVNYVGAHDQVYSRPVDFLYNRAVHLLKSRLGENWNRKLFSG